jgi:hypothetical protein
MNQNVTLSLPDDVLRAARHLAVDEGISLSKLFTQLVEEKVESRQDYQAARERQAHLLSEGLWLGTEGQIRWTRDELHER